MLTVLSFSLVPALGSSSSTVDPGIGNVPQGLQSDQAYAKSFNTHAVTNVFVTSQQVSCYRPEVPYSANNGPNDGYTGESPCPGATTGEDTGATQPLPNPGRKRSALSGRSIDAGEGPLGVRHPSRSNES